MKKLVSLLLCIIMVLGIIPVIGITASAAAEPSLKKDTDGAYLISSVEDWENFTDFTRAGSGAVLTCDGMTFRLTTDLDFTNYNGRLASTKHYLMIGEY